MIVFASWLENQGSERSGSLLEVTQLVSGGTRLPTSPLHTAWKKGTMFISP